MSSRSPHGERGLKCLAHVGGFEEPASLSSWRAWIEIFVCDRGRACRGHGRSPHGERGLKFTGVRVLDVDEVALLMESVD